MTEITNAEQYQFIASQLSCPTGEAGLKAGENMALNNSNMIKVAIDALSLRQDDAVLEIGQGSGTHVTNLFDTFDIENYKAVDISELMVEQSRINNASLLEIGKAEFFVSDGKTLPFKDNTFDKIFTVNTLYFWADPVGYAIEILRVIKRGGIFCLCFAPKEFMEKLPFTGYIFKLYTLEEAKEVLISAGFLSLKSHHHKEVVKTLAGESVERDFIVITYTAPYF